MNRARVMPNIQLPIASGCVESIFILSANQENTFEKEYFLAVRAQGFPWRVFYASIPGTVQHPAEDSSESGDSPGAQEFQPLEQFFPRGTVVGFDYEESVRPQEIL